MFSELTKYEFIIHYGDETSDEVIVEAPSRLHAINEALGRLSYAQVETITHIEFA